MQVRGFFIFTNFTHVNVENNVYVEAVNRYIFKSLLKDFGNPKADRIIFKLILKKQGDKVRTECLKLVQDTVEWRNVVKYLHNLKINMGNFSSSCMILTVSNQNVSACTLHTTQQCS
jgi:hypothetical protein